MPELLYPGVYLVESGTQAHPIGGVATSTEGLVAESLDASRTVYAMATPAWTDRNDHDPGVTMLELFGWTTEALAFGVALALGHGIEPSTSYRRQAAALDPPP